MKDKTGGNRGLRHAAALAVVAAVAVLATACGVVHVHAGSSGGSAPTGSASTGPVTFAQELALAQCMRGHGLPNFPDPSPSGGFNASALPAINSSQGQAAYGACRHLLAGGGPSLAQLQQVEQQVQQKQQQLLPTLLKFSQCMRGHGVPTFPDPSPSGLDLNGSKTNPQSPQFQAAIRVCQHALPAGAQLHVSTHASSSHVS
jgi:hypothetical protein